MLTGASPNCGPQHGGTFPALWQSVWVVCNSSKTERKNWGFAGSRCDRTFDEKKSFFDFMSEVQNDLEDIPAGIGCFFYKSVVRFNPEFNVKVGEVNFDLAR
jgi:hypothetical protein